MIQCDPQQNEGRPTLSSSGVSVSTLLQKMAEEPFNRDVIPAEIGAEEISAALRFAAQKVDQSRPTLLFLIPAIGFLLGAAHFLRWGNLIGVAICLGLPFFMLVRHWLIHRVAQVSQVFLGLMWLNTAVKIYQMRLASGMPWMRMALILGLVAAFSLFAAAMMNRARIRNWYA